ncbi:hypothetical protein F5148DRAFT_431442 [Russula earlei]|uniref:Uncharacterized protein n=1 Tax=Russula earlei TaxID=71964 RepID=A0ACC0TZL1_9AGAM|nr:hypothetical protein F5148DRAFT_431442 [Russula earlei]
MTRIPQEMLVAASLHHRRFRRNMKAALRIEYTKCRHYSVMQGLPTLERAPNQGIDIHALIYSCHPLALVRLNTMSPKLSNGLYKITNVALGQCPGHDDTPAAAKPIIGTDHHPIWVVEHVVNNRYRLSLHGFVTKPEEGFIWSYLAPQITGTEWAINETEEKSNTIIDPIRLSLRVFFWTLREKNTKVSLDLFEGSDLVPNQQWVFTPIKE